MVWVGRTYTCERGVFGGGVGLNGALYQSVGVGSCSVGEIANLFTIRPDPGTLNFMDRSGGS